MSDEELGILPLEGKYYGTLINTPWGELEVWENPGGRPSDRELASYGMTPEQWETADNETKFDITCDCHYETQADYELARSIAKAIIGHAPWRGSL